MITFLMIANQTAKIAVRAGSNRVIAANSGYRNHDGVKDAAPRGAVAIA
jgi:indole-3-glycerol phosphate synthase